MLEEVREHRGAVKAGEIARQTPRCDGLSYLNLVRGRIVSLTMLSSSRFVFLVVGVLAWAAGSRAAEWLEQDSRLIEVRKLEKSGSSQLSSPALSDMEDPVKISLDPVALVREKAEVFLQVEARHEISEPGLWVLNSMGVYDDQGREYVPQSLGKKQVAKQAGRLAERFEVPAGLPDGIYAARLLTALSTDERDQTPIVREANLYFEVEAGDLSLIDVLQFSIAANSHPAAFGKDVQ